jgi:hypothetical protein
VNHITHDSECESRNGYECDCGAAKINSLLTTAALMSRELEALKNSIHSLEQQIERMRQNNG